MGDPEIVARFSTRKPMFQAARDHDMTLKALILGPLREKYPALVLGSLLLRHLASFEESWQVVRSPCCPQQLPDVISENLSLDAGSRTPAVHRVLSPVTSTMSSAFPKQRMGRLPAFSSCE